VITTAAADGLDRASLRRKQLADDEVGPLLEEIESGQRQEWKDIAVRSPTYKSYWAIWKSPLVRDGVLEGPWESTDGRTKTAQVVIPRSKAKKVLTEMREGPSGGHFGVNKTFDKVKQWYYWLHSRDDVERWCQQCDTCAASRGPRTRTRGLMHQYKQRRKAFWADRHGHRWTLPTERQEEPVSPDYYWTTLLTGRKFTLSLTKRRRQWRTRRLTNFFCRFVVSRELHSDQGRNFESRFMQEVLERLGISKTRINPIHT
jgi:hypothetical protein